MSRVVRRPSIPSRAEIEAQNKRRRLAIAASVALLAAVILIAVVLASRVPKAASDAPVKAAISVGQPAPEFSVSTTNGPFDLKAAAGKPVLLEVFASWCPHCQREVPILDKIDAAYKSKIHFVAVNGSPYGQDSSSPETQADVVSFMEKYRVTFPVAFDSQLDVAGKYLQGGFPTLVLIGSDGTIQAIRDGEIPAGDITAALDASVAGQETRPQDGLQRLTRCRACSRLANTNIARSKPPIERIRMGSVPGSATIESRSPSLRREVARTLSAVESTTYVHAETTALRCRRGRRFEASPTVPGSEIGSQRGEITLARRIARQRTSVLLSASSTDQGAADGARRSHFQGRVCCATANCELVPGRPSFDANGPRGVRYGTTLFAISTSSLRIKSPTSAKYKPCSFHVSSVVGPSSTYCAS